MRILDLFCGAGGAAMGLRKAFPEAQIVGIDHEPQPNYPFRFLKMDWRDAFTYWQPGTWDYVWASPPCQTHSSLKALGKQAHRIRFDYIPELRNRLLDMGCNFTIENVPGAPLIDAVVLCGQYFGLGVRRHRKFESTFRVTQPDCRKHHKPNPVAVYGDHPERHARKPGSRGYINRAHTLKMGQEAMGIDWMNWRELTQAIPPAYSHYIGEQFKRLR